MRAVPDAPPTNMSAFTVSAVAAPGAAKFASRNANARRPAAAPARVVRRAGRVAQRVVAKAGPSSSDVHDEGAVDTPVWLFALPKRAAAGATGAGAAAISRSPRGAPAASPRDGGMYVELPFSTRQISSGRADARGRARTREAFARASGYASRFQVRLALTLARRGACPRVHAVAPGAGDAILFNTLLTH